LVGEIEKAAAKAKTPSGKVNTLKIIETILVIMPLLAERSTNIRSTMIRIEDN
jgi:hypothetical protein